MRKIILLFCLLILADARGIFEPKPTLNFTQKRLYDECILQENAKSCEDYLNYRNFKDQGYMSLKESAEVAKKGCDKLCNAKSCETMIGYYQIGFLQNEIIKNDKEKEFEYKLKACECDEILCRKCL